MGPSGHYDCSTEAIRLHSIITSFFQCPRTDRSVTSFHHTFETADIQRGQWMESQGKDPLDVVTSIVAGAAAGGTTGGRNPTCPGKRRVYISKPSKSPRLERARVSHISRSIRYSIKDVDDCKRQQQWYTQQHGDEKRPQRR